MKILYIGAGFVGACSAAVSADSGHEVLVHDIDAEKIRKLASCETDKIESCLFETGLAELLIRNKERIRFTADFEVVKNFIEEVDCVFMCLPTPEKADAAGQSDLSYYEKAAQTLSELLKARQGGQQSRYLVIVNKSTLPIGMVDYTREIMNKNGVQNFGVVVNPEFLVEGQAVEGSIRPPRVVVGAEHHRDFEIMRQLYSRFSNSATVKYLETNPHEAAAGKLLANFMLFYRLAACFDVIGRVCEVFPNLKFEKVREIVKSDARLGSWGLYDSLYAGGSCLVKDAASLAWQIENAGGSAELVRESLHSNDFQLNHFLGRAEAEARWSFKDQKVAVLGLAFKQGTNDVRNAPSINVVEYLLSSGAAEIRVYDPAAMDEFKKIFDPAKNEIYQKITYHVSESECLTGSSALFILTDWPQFQSVGELVKQTVKPPYLLMDGRRSLVASYDELVKNGFTIVAVGSPKLHL